jgi:chloramphenicol-sensitive protein RarD
VSWGVITLYWKLLVAIPALEILAHRIFWAFIFVLVLMVWRKRSHELALIWRDRTTRHWVALGAFFISINWFTYIWGVTHEMLVEVSLGYYINPLLTVLWGVIFINERLGRAQIAAIVLAASGVLVMALEYGRIPGLALTLAITFSFYGFVKKKTSLDAIASLTMETLLVVPITLLYIGYLQGMGQGHLVGVNGYVTLLLIFSGVVTAVPLLLFAAGARRVSLTTLGLVQYISPTMQLFMGVLMFHEPFSVKHLLSFVLIWIAILFYTLTSIRQLKQVQLNQHGGG